MTIWKRILKRNKKSESSGWIDPRPTERRVKVFCIGLPKTGTSSLHHALTMLGLRSVHFPHDPVTVRQLREGKYDLDVMKNCDAVSDVPIPAIFPQLDKAFPGSKFIHTVRDRSSWLQSERNAPFNNDPPKPGTMRDFYRTLLYGVNHFGEERFSWVYDQHMVLVEQYFAGDRQQDLLRIDVTKDPRWEPLCDFLGVAVPDAPFPHRNKGSYS